MNHKQLLSHICKDLLASDEFSEIRLFIEDNKKDLDEKKCMLVNIFLNEKANNISRKLMEFSFELKRRFFDQIIDGLEIDSGYHFGLNKEIISFADIHKSRDILLNRIQSEGSWAIELVNVDGDFIPGSRSMVALRTECCQCGKPLLIFYNFETERASLTKDTENCKYPETLPVEVSINLPGKKIVFANDLREIFDRDNFDNMFDQHIKDEYGVNFLSINNDYGVKINMEVCAKFGLLYFLTYSSKNIFIKNDGSSITIKDDCVLDEETDEDLYPILEDERNLGYVTTDLWAVTAMDFDHFSRLCHEQGFDVNERLERFNAIVVDIPGEKCKAIFYNEQLNENELKANVCGRIFFS